MPNVLGMCFIFKCRHVPVVLAAKYTEAVSSSHSMSLKWTELDDLFTIGGHRQSEFFNLDTADIWDQIILCYDGAALCIVGYLVPSLTSTH